MTAQLLKSVLVAGLLASSMVAATAAEPARDIADHRQVFIDGRFLTAKAGVSLVVHPPVKTREVTLDATHPDKTMISRNGTVLLPPAGHRTTLVDFYNSSTLKYPGAQDAYFMFPSVYYHYHEEVQQEFAGDEPTNAGPVDIRFAASRDGVTWQRYDRRPFVDLGLRDEFDAMLLYMFRGLVPGADESELFMYYTGSDRTHGWDRNVRNKRILRAAGLAPMIETSYVSRLVQRRDGFVSVRANYGGGEFTTPPLTFKGAELLLNIDTSAAGMARVEIQDEIGIPVPGFALTEADVIHTANTINRVVSWQRRTDVSALAGRTVRLRFVMRDVDLYAFQFRAPAPR